MSQIGRGTTRPIDAQRGREPLDTGTPNGAPKAARIPELPYFKEYLRDVLRPRVEAALQTLEAGLSDGAWHALVAQLAGEQNGPASDPAVLRALIEEQLGLRIEIRIQAEFGAVEPAAGAAEPDTVTAKRRPMTSNPLAQAVLDNRTRF